MEPKFSIVIPVYNRREFLVQAIESCLRQTESNNEIVVSDDCSSDDLRGVVASFHDPRLRYYRNQIRLGASRNHQQAVSRATGLYVLALNSDDFLLPECLEVAGQALDERNTAAAVYFSITYLVGSTPQGSHPVPKVPFADGEIFLANRWLENYHGTSPTCCLFRKAAFDRLGGYRSALRFAYDWDLYMRFMRVGGGVIFVPEVLSIYRKHAEQMVNERAIDGLRDVLYLWHLPEYSHWSSLTIASLVLSYCSNTVRKGGDLSQVFEELWRQKVGLKVACAMPIAFVSRVFLRNKTEEVAIQANYRLPNNVDRAVQAANNIVKSRGCQGNGT